MLHEFAVEPDVMTSWHVVRFLINLFGVEHGRVISRFPKDWQKMVHEACGRKPDLGDIEKMKIVEAIARLRSKLVSNGRPYDRLKAWPENAELEHNRRPFRAIIATANPRSHAFFLDADKLDDVVPLWTVERERKVPRDAREMAASVSLLFQMSRSIRFVDPHFTPEPRFIRPLVQFLHVARSTGHSFERIEYHLEWKHDVGTFVQNCEASLLRRVPSGCEVTFFRWKGRRPGEDLHARYVLTDVGGIRFERGLDDGEPGETTDVGPLAHGLYCDRWLDFQLDVATGRTPTFDLVDRIRVVGGQGVVVVTP